MASMVRFDVLGAITFQQRWFMEGRKDVKDMVSGLEFGLRYGALFRQTPGLHPWLLGSRFLMHILATVPALNDVHPIPKFITVGAAKPSVFGIAECLITDNQGAIEKHDGK